MKMFKNFLPIFSKFWWFPGRFTIYEQGSKQQQSLHVYGFCWWIFCQKMSCCSKVLIQYLRKYPTALQGTILLDCIRFSRKKVNYGINLQICFCILNKFKFKHSIIERSFIYFVCFCFCFCFLLLKREIHPIKSCSVKSLE